MTTSKTVAWQVAREQGVPHLVRDVFLDNQRDWDYIHAQFKKALKVSVEKGHAVLIGHPYPETITYLSQAIPVLEQIGVRLVTASELLALRTQTQLLVVR